MTNNERFEINFERMENGLPPLEGWDEWAKHQVPASKERTEEIDKALGILRGEDYHYEDLEAMERWIHAHSY